MKLFCTSILLFLFASAFAQDYRLFPKGQKPFFINQVEGIHSYVLFDPEPEFQSESNNKDSVFSLTPNVTNQTDDFGRPLFLYSILINGDQLLVTNVGTYTFPKSALPGQSWIGLDSLEVEETITYESKTYESVLGAMDSVKTYSLSGGREVKISKHYGLVVIPVMRYRKFPDSEEPGTLSVLRLFSTGILKPNYNLRDYRNIYKFNKGYVYGGKDLISDSYLYYINRWEVLDKIVRADSIIYEIALWEKQYCEDPWQNPCTPEFDRDTFNFVVKKNWKSHQFDWMDMTGTYDMCAMVRDGIDTIFTVGHVGSHEPGGGVTVSTHSITGFYQRAASPKNFRFHCYYPSFTSPSGCEEIEDLTPTFESISKESQIAIFYNSESREINLSSEEISGAKISLVDAQGRTVYSTYPQSSEVKIPCANTNGFYQLLIESSTGNFRRGVVVW